jgi:calcineurin-like phosphoesterase family protein
MRYFSSDHHVGHDNIVHNLGGGRPFNSMNHMLTVMRNNIWSTITNDDEFYIVGDSAMGNFEQSILFFAELPGKKFLIPGNHDKVGGTQSANRNLMFRPLYEEAGITVLDDVITLDFKVSWGIQQVLVSHYPYVEDLTRPDLNRKDKFKKVRPVDTGLPLIHGHTHSRYRFYPSSPRQFHIGVDANNYSPVAEPEIILWLESLKEQALV